MECEHKNIKHDCVLQSVDICADCSEQLTDIDESIFASVPDDDFNLAVEALAKNSSI